MQSCPIPAQLYRKGEDCGNGEEFEDMAGRSEYIEEAYRELERMSADERARLEYEARQKAIRDHEAIMSSAWNRGLQEGREQGAKEGREQGVAKLYPIEWTH